MPKSRGSPAKKKQRGKARKKASQNLSSSLEFCWESLKLYRITRAGKGGSGAIKSAVAIKKFETLPEFFVYVQENEELIIGHVTLPLHEVLLHKIVKLNDEEFFLTEAWDNGRVAGFSEERHHINHLREMSGFGEFFKMLDGYCMKFQLKMKKGGPVIYTEDSYQAYHKDEAKYHTRVILQLGGFGKKFCLKKGADEIAIQVRHGTVIFMKQCLGGQGSNVTHGVPPGLNKGKITGSGIIIIDLWEK